MTRKNRPPISKSEKADLKRMYSNGISVINIAKMFECTPAALYKHLTAMKVPNPRKPVKMGRVLELYNEGHSWPRLCEILGEEIGRPLYWRSIRLRFIKSGFAPPTRECKIWSRTDLLQLKAAMRECAPVGTWVDRGKVVTKSRYNFKAVARAYTRISGKFCEPGRAQRAAERHKLYIPNPKFNPNLTTRVRKRKPSQSTEVLTNVSLPEPAL
jgi:hypothetical protein